MSHQLDAVPLPGYLQCQRCLNYSLTRFDPRAARPVEIPCTTRPGHDNLPCIPCARTDTPCLPIPYMLAYEHTRFTTILEWVKLSFFPPRDQIGEDYDNPFRFPRTCRVEIACAMTDLVFGFVRLVCDHMGAWGLNEEDDARREENFFYYISDMSMRLEQRGLPADGFPDILFGEHEGERASKDLRWRLQDDDAGFDTWKAQVYYFFHILRRTLDDYDLGIYYEFYRLDLNDEEIFTFGFRDLRMPAY